MWTRHHCTRTSGPVVLLMLAIAGCSSDRASAPQLDAPSEAFFVGLPREMLALPGEHMPRPTVRVVAASGRKPRPTIVTFEVANGGGHLDGARTMSVPTNGMGYATAPSWTLGGVPGINVLIARSDGVGAVRLTVRTQDPAALTWFETSRVDSWIGSELRSYLAFTAFDPCLCKAEHGHVIERGTLYSYDRAFMLDMFGQFEVSTPAEPSHGLSITAQWAATPGMWPAGSARAWFEDGGLIVERIDPAWDSYELWRYERGQPPG